MSRSDREVLNRARRSRANPAEVVVQPRPSIEKSSISEAATRYGRGVRVAWSVTILALLLTTVSLLAHDSAQQPVSMVASVDAAPLEHRKRLWPPMRPSRQAGMAVSTTPNWLPRPFAQSKRLPYH